MARGKSTAKSPPRHGYAGMVGEHIRMLREHKGWSQDILAQRVPCTQQHVAKVELGKINTPIETLGKFAEALEVSLPRLIVLDGGSLNGDTHEDTESEQRQRSSVVWENLTEFFAFPITTLLSQSVNACLGNDATDLLWLFLV